MANTTLQLKKSGASGNVPSTLSYGELALNYADGRLFYKHANGSIASISTGSSTQSFATINANSSLILATSSSDTLSIIPGNNITISTDTFNKTITINSTAAVLGESIDQYARNTANAADILAQAAFDQANTGSGGSGNPDWGFGVIYTANNNTYANAASANAQVNFVGVNGTQVIANAQTNTVVFAGTPGLQGLTVDYGLINDPLFYSMDYGNLA